MGKFQFQSNSVHLDINGHSFDVPGTVEFAEKIRAFGVAAQARAAELGKRTDTSEALEEGIHFMWDSLDTILGPGASEAIFEGRESSIYDAIDVLMYISQEFAEFQKNKQIQYSSGSQYSPNRAQRRVEAKAASNVSGFPKPAPPVAHDISAIAHDPDAAAALIQALLTRAGSNESSH